MKNSNKANLKSNLKEQNTNINMVRINKLNTNTSLEKKNLNKLTPTYNRIVKLDSDIDLIKESIRNIKTKVDSNYISKEELKFINEHNENIERIKDISEPIRLEINELIINSHKLAKKYEEIESKNHDTFMLNMHIQNHYLFKKLLKQGSSGLCVYNNTEN